ncbi:NAD(P)/FAD-dependent oxidoreductase [Tabrizicola sp. BL-A-41-H6]|uniref:NAD(P)/FAD-dependent oxidoreductase n=1 Tax=Tabrizicola sp. BL-A-41-H6 TaxID=3421107 RepID=UPI003D673280
MTSILILGAGLLGASLAHRLAAGGHAVTIIDASLPATEASGRSFGWINASFYGSTAHFHLRHAAIAAHHRLAAEVPDTGHHWTGCLWWEDETVDAKAETLAALGYPVRILTRAEVAALEPNLATPPAHALHFSAEGAVDAAHLTHRLLATASRHGARLFTGTRATALLTKGGRITGALTEAGPFHADHTLLATGTGTPALLAPLGLTLPMLNRPGAMLRTQALPRLVSHILATPTQELRQDPQGHLLAPASASHQSDTSETLPNPAQAAAETLARLQVLFPQTPLHIESLTQAHRPVPGDGLPLAGPIPGHPNLWLALMHSGVTLAPLVAELLAAEIAGQGADPLLAPFRPDRLL